MVANIPDPPREEGVGKEDLDNLLMQNFDADEEDDDDDDEDQLDHYEGYQVLPTNPMPSDVDEEVAEENPVEETVPAGDIAAVWNEPSPRTEAASIDSSTCEQVLKAMQGFTLPASAIPPWAAEVHEDEWKAVLMEKINPTNQE